MSTTTPRPRRRTAKGHGISRGIDFWWMGLGTKPEAEARAARIVGYDRGFFRVWVQGYGHLHFSNARKFWVLPD